MTVNQDIDLSRSCGVQTQRKKFSCCDSRFSDNMQTYGEGHFAGKAAPSRTACILYNEAKITLQWTVVTRPSGT